MKGYFLEGKSTLIFATVLIALSLIFLIIELQTHFEFFLHLAAIPLEVLLAVFIVEQFLARRDAREKRKQLMILKSHLFRAEMRALFIKNFRVLKSPVISVSAIKDATLNELKDMRKQAERVEYQTLESMEPVIMEYVQALPTWRQFLDRALQFNFDDIVEDMIYLLHFISDVKLFKEFNPDKMFIHEAAKNELLMKKAQKILSDGVRKFLDEVIELKENRPEMLVDLLNDYEFCSQICYR